MRERSTRRKTLSVLLITTALGVGGAGAGNAATKQPRATQSQAAKPAKPAKDCWVKNPRTGRVKWDCRAASQANRPVPQHTGSKTPEPRIDGSTKVPIRRPAKPPHEESWIGRHTLAPGEIAVADGRETTLVLAGELELRGRLYDYHRGSAPRHVVLIADTLRIEGPATFRLAGPKRGLGRTSSLAERAAGDLTLVARRMVCGPEGTLTFDAPGGPAPREVSVRDHRKGAGGREVKPGPRYAGGTGGSLLLAADQYEVGGKVVPADDFLNAGCVTWKNPGGAAGVNTPVGQPGSVRAVGSVREAIDAVEPHGAAAVSKWVVASIRHAVVSVREAGLSAGRVEAARRLLGATTLANRGRYPILDADMGAYEQELIKLEQLRDRFATSLWSHSLGVDSEGPAARSVDLFTEGVDLRTRIAPTAALLRSRTIGGREVVGLIEFDRERPDRLRMEFEVELSADPRVAALVAEELRTEGEEFGGLFTNWTLHGREVSELGILDSRIEASPSGDGARVSLTVESARVSLVMARLASSAGLPLAFDWEYRRDRNMTGTWVGPPLTLWRRAAPDVGLDAEGGLVNGSSVPVSVEYLRLGEGRFHTLTPAVEVGPGERVALALPEGTDLSAADLPREAVAYSGMDPFRFEEDFFIVNGEQLIDQVTVTNRLGFDESRGGGLEYVEVRLVYRSGEERVEAGPYRLAPLGATGAEVTVSFVKPQLGLREVELSGTAFYEGGGEQPLASTTFSDLTIKITDELLPVLEDGEEIAP